ncbi:MAG: CoA pyrophosphatase [Eudoraea sp.]|nr:CoA pyrophosphatase [Eudoraea sp.]
MNFKEFTEQIPKIKNLPLPGRAAHYKMAPEIRIRELELGTVIRKNPKKAGVMALFYPDAMHHTQVLLILRRSYAGVHSNQVAFPGGKEEKGDPSILATALRETHEEVGVKPEHVEVIRGMSEVYIPPSNFWVQPYVGLYKKEEPFILQKEEVAQLIEVPLRELMDDSYLTSQTLSTSYAKNIEVPAFELKGFTVWGATAMMLNEIRELIKQVV